MTSPLAAAIARSGILDEESLSEFRRWGLPIDELPIGPKPTSVQELVLSIEEALQSEGLVIEKVTDLEAVQQYINTQAIGILHIQIGTESADFDVPYGRNHLGEYLFPWKGDTVAEEMTNGTTYLVPSGTEDKIFFSNLRELYFGDNKAFMACTPYQGSMVAHVERQ